MRRIKYKLQMQSISYSITITPQHSSYVLIRNKLKWITRSKLSYFKQFIDLESSSQCWNLKQMILWFCGQWSEDLAVAVPPTSSSARVCCVQSKASNESLRRFHNPRKRPLLEPSPVWKRLLLALSHLRHYASRGLLRDCEIFVWSLSTERQRRSQSRARHPDNTRGHLPSQHTGIFS